MRLPKGGSSTAWRRTSTAGMLCGCYICATHGALAQLGEHLLCKQGVAGSIPARSTTLTKVPSATYGAGDFALLTCLCPNLCPL